MPKLKAKDIRQMSHEERLRKLRELRIELMKLRGQLSAGGIVENPSRIKEIRKAIARILTVIREEELKRGRK
ncbi:MAG: 50S ribosomal protein L29 [Thermofilum sp. ex4484_15]|nr:MAG: 50S ribosomal protein L29 [Thermofilum sp. ex4484_15]